MASDRRGHDSILNQIHLPTRLQSAESFPLIAPTRSHRIARSASIESALASAVRVSRAGCARRPEEACNDVDYQGARIISLESNRRPADQVAWLRDVLKNNPQRWTILTFHHPVFSPANNRGNPDLRAMWKPILDEFKVDLVLTGHDHSYARSGDVSGRGVSINVPSGYNQAYDPKIGTVYVVSASVQRVRRAV